MTAKVDSKMLLRLKLITIATLLMAFAGVLHLVIAPIHSAHAPAHGLFFVLTGIVQLVWAIAVWRRPSMWLYDAGIFLAGGLVVLWALTRFVPAPFGHGAEAVDRVGVICKIAEGLVLVALLILVHRATVTRARRQTAWRAVGLRMLVTVATGLLTYGVARATEPMLPSLATAEAHQHEHADEVRPTLTR